MSTAISDTDTKIFITVPWFLPAFRAGGPPVSLGNLVTAMDKGYMFYIFCGNSDLNNFPLKGIEADIWTQFNEYTKVWYDSGKNTCKNIKSQVAVVSPKVLYINGLFSYPFNIFPLLFLHVPSKILSVRGMLHPGALSQKSIKKKIFLNLFKLMGVHKNILFHATDESERNHIQNEFPGSKKIAIAYNVPKILSGRQLPAKNREQLKLVSIGLISPMKNILLVLESLGSLTASIQYTICGPIKDEFYWNECKQAILRLPKNIGVEVKGGIEPDHISDILAASHVFILPSKSENFGHAIYEALETGLPVITSTFTPWNNLKESNAGLNVETNVKQIAAAIQLYVNMDDLQFQQQSRNAMNYAKQAIDVSSIKLQYDQMFKNL